MCGTQSPRERLSASLLLLSGGGSDGGPHSGHFTGLILTRGWPKNIFFFESPNFFFIGLRPSETNRKDEKKLYIHCDTCRTRAYIYIYIRL